MLGWKLFRVGQAHLVGYNEPGITHSYYTESQQRHCVYWNGNCSVHSWGYISVEDTAATQWHCAEKLNTSYPSFGSVDDSECAYGSAIARLCTTHQAHAGGSGPLHCMDQDVNNWKVGGWNGSNFGTTLRRHALY
jgi:hypothetical protein